MVEQQLSPRRDDEALDLVFHALADETRRGLVRELSRNRARTVSQLAAPYDMSLAAVSKHLQVLERAGVITKTREGRRQWCRLNPQPLTEAAALIERYRRFWERQLDALEGYLKAAGGRTGRRKKRGGP